MKARRLARSWGERLVSRPSGMRLWPVEVELWMSARGRVISAPPIILRVTPEASSWVMMPGTRVPSFLVKV